MSNAPHTEEKTVICVLNAKYVHASPAPWCLLAGIRAYGKKVRNAEIVEGTINEPAERAAARICAKQPRAVGFCCYIWNITATRTLVRLVKARLPGVTLILGGPEVSFRPKEILMEWPEITAVVSGEGERPFAALLDALCAGKPAAGIPGVAARIDGAIVSAPPSPPKDDPPRPTSAGYAKALHGRIAYLEGSRGCPFSCAFCLSGCGGARFFDLARTEEDLLLLASSGSQTVKFVDRTFNANPARAKALIRFILAHYGTQIPRGVCFHFEIAGDLLDDEEINLLASAPRGSVQLEIGLQSFHEDTLAAVARRTDLEKLKRNVRLLLAPGNVHVHLDLIAGLPHEGLTRFEESFNAAFALRPHMLQLGFLKLLYGSAMRRDPERFPCRFSPRPPYEVAETPWLSAAELARLHGTEDALERLYNSGRFRRTLAYLLERTKWAPFALFDRFGAFCAQKKIAGIPLDDYCALVFRYFSDVPEIDAARLRDLMACDRLITNSTGRLPPVLRTPDARLKPAVRAYEKAHPRPAGVKRGFAWLFTENRLVCAEYKGRDPVSGEWPLK